MAKIAVLGAGVAGLGVALAAGRAGHEVVLIERDDTPLAVSPAEAFDWDRQGAPQVRHSHAFLARLRNLLRDRYPDVLEALYTAGATPMDFISMLPEGMDRTPLPGDEDLVAIACRRTTFEWVLRKTILNEPSVKLVHGMGVTGLQTNQASDRTGVAQVTGLTLEDGTVVQADITVIAGGRRHDLPGLLSASGVAIRETIEDTGIVYFSRFFQLRKGAEFPAQTGPIGGDLGYLKFGVFPGDNRSFSITLAAGVTDRELRRQLTDPDQFITIAAQIPATAAHVEGDRSEPITGVNIMAGLLNRRRGFLDESGEPLVLGLHAVGDAHTCTNPLYGRGCSLALVQAELFADSLKEHGLNHRDRSVAFEGATRDEITPWYRASVAQDRLNADSTTVQNGTADAATSTADAATSTADAATSTAGAATSTADAATSTADAATSTSGAREFMRDGLLPAMRTDPVVVRAFLRMFNLLEAPNSLMTNSDVVARVLTVFNDRENRPAEVSMGPDRASLLEAIS